MAVEKGGDGGGGGADTHDETLLARTLVRDVRWVPGPQCAQSLSSMAMLFVLLVRTLVRWLVTVSLAGPALC